MKKEKYNVCFTCTDAENNMIETTWTLEAYDQADADEELMDRAARENVFVGKVLYIEKV